MPRMSGTPQGGVISPILANLFLHYAFDMWMARRCPHIPFERYADDAICHCKSAEEAQVLWSALADRFAACKLVLHPEKTKIVYCKDANRRGDFPIISFETNSKANAGFSRDWTLNRRSCQVSTDEGVGSNCCSSMFPYSLGDGGSQLEFAPLLLLGQRISAARGCKTALGAER